jgi:formiminotetrahydrofolate cyclodeaminase
MESSIWSSTLESFIDRMAGTESTPASVTAAAVTASFASALLIKVLEISAKRKDFSGDRQKLLELMKAIRVEKSKLALAADEDILAFRSYMDYLRMPRVPDDQGERKSGIFAAARRAVEVPMSAARSAVHCLELCVATIDFANSAVAADVAGAAALLSGAVRTIVVSVDSNLRQLRGDAHYYTRTISERQALEERANRLADQTLRRTLIAITIPLGSAVSTNETVKVV